MAKWWDSYQESFDKAGEKADEYQETLKNETSPEALEARKKRASATALGQAKAASNASQSAAQSAARKSGMSGAQAAMLGGSKASEGFTNTYQNAYTPALAQENTASEARIAAAKDAYAAAKDEHNRKREESIGWASTFLGILSDERIKNIKAKWDNERRK